MGFDLIGCCNFVVICSGPKNSHDFQIQCEHVVEPEKIAAMQTTKD